MNADEPVILNYFSFPSHACFSRFPTEEKALAVQGGEVGRGGACSVISLVCAVDGAEEVCCSATESCPGDREAGR